MSSPAKKRKKNDHSATDVPVRRLDYFFKKQVEKAEERGKPSAAVATDDAGLTDEELARKLQAEWNQEVEVSPSRTDGRNKAVGPQDEPQDLDIKEADSSLPASAPFPGPVVSKNILSLQPTGLAEDAVTAEIPLDESPLVFDSGKYASELTRFWDADQGQATYALLTRCFVLVNATASRIKIVDTLVNTIRVLIESDAESLLPAVWLATNSIAPPYQDLELGLGGSVISKALKTVCGLDGTGLRTLYSKFGDAGDVAYEAKKRQSFTLKKPKPLTIRSVYQSLVKIANSKGQGSQQIKQQIVERLLLDSRGAEESRYITRTLVQHLRIGAVKTTMLIALSRACLLSRPRGAEYATRSVADLAKLKKEELAEVYHDAEEIVKACYARHPNYADLVPALLEVGVCPELLVRCGLALHIPIRPMLGSITRDLGDMLNRLQGRRFACEYKYDGQRAQVHCDDKGRVSIFSRHLETMTDKYPDLVALVPTIRGEGVSSFILEGEVVAIDHLNGELKTFQTLSNRAKKDVAVGSITVGVCLFAFDLMYLNGEELMNRSFGERRSLLKSLFIEIPHKFTWVKSLDATSADSDAVLEFYKGATDAKCEGIMVKVLDNPPAASPDEPETESKPTKSPAKRGKLTKQKASTTRAATETQGDEPPPSRRKALLSTYEPDKRLESWLKVKKDYHAAADTLDVIPVAAWHGSGRKNKWWSPILLAVRQPDTGQLVAVTKCMSGFTDTFYAANRAKYDPAEGINVISRPSYIEYSGPEPTVWFEPQEVWEIAFADVTLSPTYTAAVGLVSDERGLSLRFPRFLKVREDKSIEEGSTDEFLAELYRKQAAKAPQDIGKDGDEDLDN